MNKPMTFASYRPGENEPAVILAEAQVAKTFLTNEDYDEIDGRLDELEENGGGDPGTPGEPGFSPIANVTQIANGVVITITDKDGTTTATVTNGADGEDGTSVAVKSVSESTADGGSNIVTFSDGKTVTIKNGSKGTKGDNGDKGDKGDKGEKGEAGKDYVLTDADKTEIASLVKSEGIPEYWQPALDEGVKAINTALCEAGYNKSAFLFYSDAHWNYGSQRSPSLLKYLYRHTGMTKTFFGGDVVNDESYEYDPMEYLWDWRNQLKDLPNHHSVVGNHDDAGATSVQFTEQYVYGYLLAAEENCEIVRGDKGFYYYIDSPVEKTRYLYLDTGFKDYSSLSAEQKTFISEALKTTPDKWHIVVVAHVWYEPDYDQYSVVPIPVKGLSNTASSIAGILDDYNDRVGDFAECAAWVEFCIGGHVHRDFDGATPRGIPIVLVETDSHHTRSGLACTAGTTTEASVNGIIADYDAKKIKVVRVGRGSSRQVAMTWYEVNYTNVLDTVGFVENKYISASSGYAEKDRDGVDLTGYIPVKHGDIIRLKNVTMPDVGDYSNKVYYFNSSKVGTAAASITSAAGNGFNPVYENGNLVQFTVLGKHIGYTSGAESAVTGFIRIGAGNIDSSSIITVNEEISVPGDVPSGSYTNALPLAVASDGVTIYNGTGYKAGVRWSSSGNAESTSNASGLYLSGFIPVKKNSVVRLKNITMNKANAASNGCAVHTFLSLTDTNEGTMSGDTLTNYASAIWDDSGNLVQFTLNGTVDYAFIRLQGTYMGADSIVTIDEEMK